MENGKSRLQQTQEQVEEVKIIMIDNMSKADDRTHKLEDLDRRADDLLITGKRFEKTSKKVERQKHWENKKMRIIFIAIGVTAALVLFGLIIFAIFG